MPVEVEAEPQSKEKAEEKAIDRYLSGKGKFRNIPIRAKVEIKKYNPTPLCGGCDAIELGISGVTHDPHCRERILVELNDYYYLEVLTILFIAIIQQSPFFIDYI